MRKGNMETNKQTCKHEPDMNSAMVMEFTLLDDGSDSGYIDYDGHLNNVAGRDWMVRVWFDKEQNRWAGPLYHSSAADGVSTYDTEHKPEDTPGQVKAEAEAAFERLRREVFDKR